jgi:hypothetical protein
MKGKGLQKLTETRRMIMEILEKPEVVKSDLNSLDNEARVVMQEVVNERLMALKGKELDGFIERIFDIISPESRNSMWDDNHRRIINEISKFIDNTGRMPTMFELMDRTGLSRQTLGKHIKEYRSHPQYIEHLEQFRFMGQKVLSKMFEMAMNGNVRAGRLYLEMVGGIGDGKGRGVRNQTNYIQVNNLVISEERLRELSPDQLGRIETILTEVADPQISMVKKREE